MVNNSALQPDQEAGIAAESSPVDNPAPSRTNSIGAWTLRLLLALLLLFGSEILLWIDPPGRAATDWLLLGVGYITLSAVLLDLAARYGIRNLYDVMALTALYALGVGLLLNPQIGLVNFPVEFMTYVMGAHSLLGLEMLGVFFFLTGGRNRPARRLLLGYSLWVGFYWGTWVRWSPSLSDWLVDEVSLTTMFTIAGAMLVVGGVLTAFSFRRAQALSAPDMLLSQNMQGISAAILAGIFALRLAEGQVNIGMVVLTLFVGVLCVGILWFQRPTKGAILLDAHLPPKLPPMRQLFTGMMVFAISTIIAYNLPLVDVSGHGQLTLMQLGFSAVGLLWMPIVAAVVGVQGMDRLDRASRF